MGAPGGLNGRPRTAELWWCQGTVVVWFMGLGVRGDLGPCCRCVVCPREELRAGVALQDGDLALSNSSWGAPSPARAALWCLCRCPPLLCGAAFLVLALEQSAGTPSLGCHCLGHRCAGG